MDMDLNLPFVLLDLLSILDRMLHLLLLFAGLPLCRVCCWWCY